MLAISPQSVRFTSFPILVIFFFFFLKKNQRNKNSIRRKRYYYLFMLSRRTRREYIYVSNKREMKLYITKEITIDEIVLLSRFISRFAFVPRVMYEF